MQAKRMGVGIIGCGNIGGPYAKDLQHNEQLELIGVADLDPARAEQLAAQVDCRAYPTVDAMLADDAIELVINLTIHHAHVAVTTRALEAGKHVYSEKPLALNYEDAQALVALAHEKNLRLGCSPMTFMGEAQQTALQWIRSGRLGTLRLAYAEINHGRIETWHPAPQPFYEVGVLFDVAVYPLTMLTTVCGPARRVWTYGTRLKPERVTKDGTPFHIDTPDFYLCAIEMADGTLVRLTASFYVSVKTKQGGSLEFHGDAGSLHMGSWHYFNSSLEFAPYDQPYEPVPLVREPEGRIRWGRGVRDMVDAIAQNRPHRATGEQAAHVVEILCAASESARTSLPVAITSTFTPPAPLEWAVLP